MFPNIPKWSISLNFSICYKILLIRANVNNNGKVFDFFIKQKLIEIKYQLMLFGNLGFKGSVTILQIIF